MRSRLVSLLLLFCTVTAQAAVTTVAQYRLGEADPGAAAGGAGANPTVASVGAINLARNGVPVYSAVTPPGVNSTLSMAFNSGVDRYTGSIVTTAANNFGVEAWVRSNGSTAVNACLVYNGNTGNSGWGLFRLGNEFGFLYGGVALDGVTPVTTSWTHLALVRDAGTTRFFVNGQQVVSSSAAPNPPAGGFLVGGNPLVTTEGFDGLIDEVRVFTFEPGQFVVSDLGYVAPPPPPAIPLPASSALLQLLLTGLLLLSGAVLVRRTD